MMEKSSRTEKIALLKKLREKDEEVAILYEIVDLTCPYILDNPEDAPDSIIKQYNQLIRCNIAIIETRDKLLI